MPEVIGLAQIMVKRGSIVNKMRRKQHIAIKAIRIIPDN